MGNLSMTKCTLDSIIGSESDAVAATDLLLNMEHIGFNLTKKYPSYSNEKGELQMKLRSAVKSDGEFTKY